MRDGERAREEPWTPAHCSQTHSDQHASRCFVSCRCTYSKCVLVLFLCARRRAFYVHARAAKGGNTQ